MIAAVVGLATVGPEMAYGQVPVPYEGGARCIAALELPALYACDVRFLTDTETLSLPACLEISAGVDGATFTAQVDDGSGGDELNCTCHPGGDGSDEDGDPFAEGAASNEFVCHNDLAALSGSFRSNGRLIPNAVGIGESDPFIVSLRCALGPCTPPVLP